jgi:two-component system, OmpR family, sensor histidine kinase BaeS
MKLGLRFKLSLAFFLVAVLLFATLSLLANFFLEKQFKEYVLNKQEQKNTDIVALLASRYADWGGKWDMDGLDNIGVNTLGEGLMLRVHDRNGTVLWDAQVHDNGMCASILAHMAQNMQTLNKNFQGGYEEKTYPIISGNIQAGSVDVGYYGPYFYTDIDIQFLSTINNLLLWAAVVSAIASIVLGVVLARQLTRPIAHVIQTTQNIAEGNFDDRIHEKSSTKEIAALTTSINSLAETLGQQEKLRKRLTADVAHELRTPIATLQSHLEAMIDGTWKADTDRLGSCHEEVVRVSKLVGDLERLTRYEGENLVLHYENFDLAALLRRIVTNFQGEYKNKGVALTLDAPETSMEADEDKVCQIFINLLSNALKYTPTQGQVDIKLYRSEKFVEVRVWDTGIGIGSEDLPYIFDRFYRTDKSRTRISGGSGIGLAIVKAIVEAHDGDIRVASEPGRGSTFIVILPRHRNSNV